eukprot:scaffold4009_cov124-Cylindrotheca_fusiformis.AAC.9
MLTSENLKGLILRPKQNTNSACHILVSSSTVLPSWYKDKKMKRRFLKGSSFSESDGYPDTLDLSRSLQYNPDGSVCQELDVVAACEGTSNQDTYTGIFRPINKTECSGVFEEGLPVYKHAGGSLYLYPIAYYSDSYSKEDYRGLVRWRLSSFHHKEDKSCRRTQANMYQIDFAADGQPYNYYPIISCFDEHGSDLSGYQESRIVIICKDDLMNASDDEDLPLLVEKESTDTPLIVGMAIVAILLLLGFGFWYKRSRSQKAGTGAFDSDKKDSSPVEEGDSINPSRALTDDSPSSDEDKLDDGSLSDSNLDKPHKAGSSLYSIEDDIDSRGRSRSTARVFAGNVRDGSLERAKSCVDFVGKVRSNSLERSKSERFTEKSVKFVSVVLPSAEPGFDRLPPSRSLSLENSEANAFAQKEMPRDSTRGRPRSTNTTGPQHLQAETNGSKGRPKGRSLSLERSKANEFAKKKRIPSIERSKANDFAAEEKSNKAATSNEKAKLGSIATKQLDGSVIVADRRQGQDGAIVTTKTKYASVAAARKRGIEV